MTSPKLNHWNTSLSKPPTSCMLYKLPRIQAVGREDRQEGDPRIPGEVYSASCSSLFERMISGPILFRSALVRRVIPTSRWKWPRHAQWTPLYNSKQCQNQPWQLPPLWASRSPMCFQAAPINEVVWGFYCCASFISLSTVFFKSILMVADYSFLLSFF